MGNMVVRVDNIIFNVISSTFMEFWASLRYVHYNLFTSVDGLYNCCIIDRGGNTYPWKAFTSEGMNVTRGTFYCKGWFSLEYKPLFYVVRNNALTCLNLALACISVILAWENFWNFIKFGTICTKLIVRQLEGKKILLPCK